MYKFLQMYLNFSKCHPIFEKECDMMEDFLKQEIEIFAMKHANHLFRTTLPNLDDQ